MVFHYTHYAQNVTDIQTDRPTHARHGTATPTNKKAQNDSARPDLMYDAAFGRTAQNVDSKTDVDDTTTSTAECTALD